MTAGVIRAIREPVLLFTKYGTTMKPITIKVGTSMAYTAYFKSTRERTPAMMRMTVSVFLEESSQSPFASHVDPEIRDHDQRDHNEAGRMTPATTGGK